MTLHLHAHVILSLTLMSYTSSPGSTLLKLNIVTKPLLIPDELQLWNLRLEVMHSSRPNSSV